MKQQNDLYDVVVVGGGPAGLTAGLYLARARYRVLILEKDDFGGQITITSEVVNYPGVASTDGRRLTETMRQQAEDFGAEFKAAQATGLSVDGEVKTVHTNRGDIRTFGILIATGANPRRIGFEGESEYAGRGISYCATCDGEFFDGKEVLVVGGGFSAAEESVFLTKYAKKVTILVFTDDFTCDAAVAEGAKNNPKIEIHYNTELKAVAAGQGGLAEATILDRKTGEERVWKPTQSDTFGVFVFAGYVPQTDILAGVVELNEHGYVTTHGYLETSVPGVYAAGDLREKNLRQVVTAVSDGAVAAVELERYAKDMSEKTGLVPPRPTDSPYEKREAQKAEAAKNSATSPAPAPSQGTMETAGTIQTSSRSGFFNEAIIKQLNMVFDKMTRPLILRLELDGTKLSRELEGFIDELVDLGSGRLSSQKVRAESGSASAGADGKAGFDPGQSMPDARPCVRLCIPGDDGEPVETGLAFHGVPSGHEFNSFVLGLYNAAGPGQSVDADSDARIRAIDTTTEIMILVSLTCTMCPTTVLSAQRIAAGNTNVRAEAYDISHYPELQNQYHAMSVPCIVINTTDANGATKQTVEFGKKSVPQILDLIEQSRD